MDYKNLNEKQKLQQMLAETNVEECIDNITGAFGNISTMQL